MTAYDLTEVSTKQRSQVKVRLGTSTLEKGELEKHFLAHFLLSHASCVAP